MVAHAPRLPYRRVEQASGVTDSMTTASSTLDPRPRPRIGARHRSRGDRRLDAGRARRREGRRSRRGRGDARRAQQALSRRHRGDRRGRARRGADAVHRREGRRPRRGKGPAIDIALDPLEGTTITAKAGPNALAVLAVAEKGCLLNAPDVYMEKIAIGPGYPEGTIDLAKSATENVHAIAAAKGVRPEEIIACVLDRPRHEKLVAELRAIGCGIMLIPDGDVAGVIAHHRSRHHDRPSIWVKAARPRACSRRRRCAASAGSSRGGWCSATTTSAARAAKWGHRGSRQDLRPDRARQGRLHLRRDRRDRRIAARGRQARRRQDDHRERR